MNKSCGDFSRYLAELVGTMILVLIGVGSAVLAGGAIGTIGVSFAFGLSLLVLAYAIGPVSGCHVNPAVSLGMFFLDHLSLKDTIFYIIFQLIGGVLGAFLVYSIATGKMDHTPITNLATNGYNHHSPQHYGILAVGLTEIVMTTLLLLVVFSTTNKKFAPGFGGIAVGITLVVIHFFSIPVSNASVNFARSFGPAVIEKGVAFTQLWLFALSQCIAVGVALVLYRLIYADKCSSS